MWLHHCKSWENALADPLISTYIQNGTSSIFIRRLRAKLSLNGNILFFFPCCPGPRYKGHEFMGKTAFFPGWNNSSRCCYLMRRHMLHLFMLSMLERGHKRYSYETRHICRQPAVCVFVRVKLKPGPSEKKWLHQNAQSSDFYLHSHIQHGRVGNIISVVIVTGDHCLLT